MSKQDLDKLDLSNKAKLLLENQLLNKWWESAEFNLLNEFKATDFKQVEKLQELNCKLTSLIAMRKDFERYMRAGEKARSTLGSKEPDRAKGII